MHIRKKILKIINMIFLFKKKILYYIENLFKKCY